MTREGTVSDVELVSLLQRLALDTGDPDLADQVISAIMRKGTSSRLAKLNSDLDELKGKLERIEKEHIQLRAEFSIWKDMCKEEIEEQLISEGVSPYTLNEEYLKDRLFKYFRESVRESFRNIEGGNEALTQMFETYVLDQVSYSTWIEKLKSE